MTRRTANLALLFAGAIWGMGFVAQSSAMDNIGPLLFIGLRFIIASLVLCPLALWEYRKRQHNNSPSKSNQHLTPRALASFALIGIMLFLTMTLQQIGLLTTSVTNSGVLTGLYVIFVPLLGLITFRQIPHWIIWPATLLSFIGLFLLSGGALSGFVIGDVLTIGCAIATAFQVILIAKYAFVFHRPMLLSFIQFSITALLAILCAIIFETISIDAIMPAIPEILYTGLVSGALAFTIQVVAQRYTTAPQAAIFMSTEVLFAALFASIFLSEYISTLGYIGGLFIFTAIILTETIPHRKIKP